MVTYDRLSIHPAQGPECARILKGKDRVHTTDRDINYLNMKGYLQKDIIENPFYSSQTAWFGHAGNMDHGLTLYVKRKAEFDRDSNFSLQNQRYCGSMRSSAYITERRTLYGSNGP